MIQARKLVKRFGTKTVLRGLDLNVSPGEFVALLGPNGAGKTTLLRILASLSNPSSGEVFVSGHRLPHQAEDVRIHLGAVFHSSLLYGELTAEENLFFYGNLYGISQLRQRVTEILELVGLGSRATDLVRTYSRGMQQRLAIGRAVLHNPDLMLLDEPHTGLDEDSARMLNEVLRSVAAQGRTILMATHDLLRAEALASRFDVLSHGQLTASTSPRDLRGRSLLTFYRQAIAD